MEIRASRLKTRINAKGEPILLMDQNRAKWYQLLIRRGLAALERSRKLGRPFGPYSLQAAISAFHAQAPSLVVELNRAVAISMAFGPVFGLQIIDELNTEPSL